MKLTDRLLKIASLVDKDKRLADIGTDHGYIPVYLLNKNTIQYAILGDVNKGPLDNAKKEVREVHFLAAGKGGVADFRTGVRRKNGDEQRKRKDQ